MRGAYQVITDRVIELLEKGTPPWHKPWGGDQRHPRNLVSDKKYRGINAFMLSVAGYHSPYWLTFKQAKNREGHVRKGERGYPCIYWNWHEKEDPETKETVKIPFLKFYTVFNVNQCEKIVFPATENHVDRFQAIEACEKVREDMPNPPEITHHELRAYYNPGLDLVNMPAPEFFDSSEDYYAGLFHELTHATGHESRLARPGINWPIIFGSRNYSKEELVAEMGAAFLCGHTGIENKVIDNSVAYINSWLSRLRKDNKLVVQAAAQAQKASDYILDRKQGDERDST